MFVKPDDIVKVARVIERPERLDKWTEDPQDRADEEKLALRTAEKDALRKADKTSFWDQPWPLKSTILMLCTAAVVQGWSQTGINAANLSWPRELHLAGPFGSGDPTQGSGGGWAFAAVNAAPYFAASMYVSLDAFCCAETSDEAQWLLGLRSAE